MPYIKRCDDINIMMKYYIIGLVALICGCTSENQTTIDAILQNVGNEGIDGDSVELGDGGGAKASTAVTEILVLPGYENLHGFNVQIEETRSLHPHRKMVRISVQCPLKQDECEFKDMNITFLSYQSLVARIPIAVLKTNGFANGSFTVDQKEICNTSLTVSYYHRNYPTGAEQNPGYYVMLEAYNREYKKDHNQQVEPTSTTPGDLVEE